MWSFFLGVMFGALLIWLESFRLKFNMLMIKNINEEYADL